MKQLERWTGLALINLSIVAMLGLVLRLKIIFSIPLLDFKYLLHAHSHFAFGGWVTLALLALFTFKILPAQSASKPVYKWLLTGIFINAAGMLISFPLQGYAAWSILFSTLFIFVTYVYAYVFIKDILRAEVQRPVRILAISAMACMVLSSAGAFTLAYLLATHSSNMFLYKDAIYTYLHLQYNGFFSLAILALLLQFAGAENKQTRTFAWLIALSIIPSMFMSYLWHYPNIIFRMVAMAGSALTLLSLASFLDMMHGMRNAFGKVNPLARKIALVALTCFATKLAMQAITVIPALGELVFSNRPVIIGFLHLVLLGFITLFLLAYFIQTGLLPSSGKAAAAVGIFVTGVIINEFVLMIQGLGIMLMITSAMANWLLLIAASLLFTGAILIVIIRFGRGGLAHPYRDPSKQNYFVNYKTNTQ